MHLFLNNTITCKCDYLCLYRGTLPYDHPIYITTSLKIKITESFYYFEHLVNATTLLLQLGVNLIKILRVHSTRVPLFKSLKTIATPSC